MPSWPGSVWVGGVKCLLGCVRGDRHALPPDILVPPTHNRIHPQIHQKYAEDVYSSIIGKSFKSEKRRREVEGGEGSVDTAVDE